MKCPGCGYVSFDRLESCKRCGAPISGVSGASPGSPAPTAGDDSLELCDDDLAAPSPPAVPGDAPDETNPWQPFPVEPPEPSFGPVAADWAPGGGEPVIDSDEEIPDRFWAPEIAGLGRRSAALLIDQALLALLLGVFFFAAYLALQVSGFDADLLLAPAGLQAALFPIALLAVVLSLAYQAFFHGYAGRTPGKALAGIEVRTVDGAVPSRGRVLLRWFCAALGLAAAGLGPAWALFEPRRRGWADLLSGTVIARRQRDPAAEGRRR